MSKILHISRNFPPLIGGMERLNSEMARLLSDKHQIAILGPKGVSKALGLPRRVIELPANAGIFLLLATFAGLRLMFSFRPDIVLAGSGLVAPVAWLVARCSRARLVIYVHGLDIVAEHVLYRRLWLWFIRRADLCIANSRNTACLAQSKGVPPERIQVLNPGVALPRVSDHAGEDFRVRYQLSDRPLLLSVGRVTKRKGLYEFVQKTLPILVAAQPDILLLVVGGDASQALGEAARSQRKGVEELARNTGFADNLRFLGEIDDQELSEAYQAAGLHVFPILDMPGDVEGFGMVALEAAAHGLPTVAFAVGGVPDAVSRDSGILVPAGSYEQMAEVILKQLQAEMVNRERCRAFAAGFAWPEFGKRLETLLQAMDG